MFLWYILFCLSKECDVVGMRVTDRVRIEGTKSWKDREESEHDLLCL